MNADGLSVAAAAAESPDTPALVTEERSWTWAEAAKEVRREAESLRPGQRVAFDAPPTARTVFRLFAAIEAGACAVPLPENLPAPERARRLAMLGDDVAAPPDELERPLAVLFTSGTGGAPRAVELSRRAFLASAAASAENLGWEPDDRWLCALPLAHVAGVSILTRCLVARRAIVLTGGFAPERVSAALHRDRATLASFVPTMVHRLLEPAERWETPRHLRAALVGGAPIPASLWDRMNARRFPALATYGMTETCSQVATARFPSPGDLVPLPGVHVRVREGRIEVGGPTLCSRIVGEGDASAAWTADGYLKTRDLGEMHDGTLRVLGRADDVIVTGGHNVAPAAVEAILEGHEAVRRAVVFGVADELWGERVTAVLEADQGGTQPTEADLQAWLGERLAPQDRPRRVRWVARLPETATGKVDRAAARSLAPGDGA